MNTCIQKLTIVLACCLFFCVSLRAQTYTSGQMHVTTMDSIRHDSTYCTSYYTVQYLVTIDSSFTGDTVRVIDTMTAWPVSTNINTTGASPWTFTAYVVSEQRSDLFVTPYSFVNFSASTYKVVGTHDTVKYLTPHDSLFVTNPCSYGYVAGRVYADNNSNCVFDSGDVDILAVEIDLDDYLSSPVGEIYQPISSTGSTYSYPIQQSWMTHYTVSMPSYLSFIFPFSPCFSGSYLYTTLPQTAADFPLQCTTLVDVQAAAMSPTNVRLHRSFYIQPFVHNFGCDSVSGQLTLVKDHRAIYDASLSTLPADIVSGDTLIWNYSGLSNLSAGAYWNSFLSDIYLSPDSTLAVGDTLCFFVYANVPATDVDPSNNQYSFCLPVVYSFDPNEKEVSPRGSGPEGFIPVGPDTLTYALHFQNTGSDYAYDVKVIDTLDSHINPSTLRILGASHTMMPKWIAPNVVEFDFNSIFLPDSSMNEAASHGEVKFSVALNTGLAAGTQIHNTGYIYFDANPPVVTNTTLNTLIVPTKTEAIQTAKPVRIYPNPATDHVTVENLGDGQVLVLDVNGVVLKQQTTSGSKTTVDISNLPVGIYMLKATNSNATTTTRITKF